MKLSLPMLLAALGASLLCNAVLAQQVPSYALYNSEVTHCPATLRGVKPGMHHQMGAGAKITGIGSRLTSEVSGSYNATHHWLPDSFAYTYSSAHGGDYENITTPYPLKYDSATHWITDVTTLAYKPDFRRWQTFNPITDQIAVQTEQQWTGTAWVYSSRIIFSYTATGRLDTTLTQHYNTTTSAWVNYDRIVSLYNAAGITTGNSYATWSTSTNSFQVQNAYQYTLDASNNRIMELESSYDVTTMTMKPGFRVFHYYNAANVEYAYAYQSLQGSTWTNTDSTFYILNAGNQVTEYLYYHWNTTSSIWIKTGHLLEAYTATGKSLYEVSQDWNNTTSTYTNHDSSYRIYNISDQLSFYYFYSFYPGVNDAESHNHYEQYTTTGTGNQPRGLQEVSIYPIPANNLLYISMSLPGGQPVTCTIYDVAGSIVRFWKDDAPASAYNRKLSLDDVPSGTYWLRVTTPGAAITKKLVIVH